MRFLALLPLTACLLPQVAQTPTEANNKRFVEVSVVVHDHKGQPISDLTKGDFTLVDRGKPQIISAFRSELASRFMAKLTLGPNVYANRLTSRGEIPTAATVVLFDGINTRFRDQADAGQRLIAFLQEIEFDDRMAIYVLGREMILLHDFIGDPNHLLQLLGASRTGATGNSEISRAIAAITDLADVDRGQQTLFALETIANHLAGVPGRKNLVWVADGFPSDLGLDFTSPDHSQHTAERALRAITEAAIAIYPVTKDGSAGTLAENSGGRVFTGIKSAVRAAVEDANSAYLLGFNPSQDDWDGAYHPLQVKLDQRGFEVRARKGFLAFKDQLPSPAQVDSVVLDTLAGPLDATVIPLFVRTGPSDKPDKGSLRLTLQIDPASITIQSKNGHYVAILEVAMRQLPSSGSTYVLSTSETYTLTIQPDVYLKILKESLLLNTYVSPQKGAVQLRVVVLDRPSGAIGSVHLPIAGGS